VRGAARSLGTLARLFGGATLAVALIACGTDSESAGTSVGDPSPASSSPTTSSVAAPTWTSPSTTIPTTEPATTPTTPGPPSTAPSTSSPPPATTRPPTPPASTTAPTTPPTTSRSTAVRRIPTDLQVIALTLDAGSDLGYTNLVLDTLSEKQVQASFGITGEFAEAHPDHVRRMAREGHVVMNHSHTHFSFTGVSSSEVLLTTSERQADLRRADGVLAPLVGTSTTPYWRPPFGDYDTSVLDDVGAIGYGYTVMWTFDSLGWRGLSADQIVTRVRDLAEPGAIIVMHVGSQSQDGPALGRVIDELRSMGYSFTTVANALRR
jgi:peptidoglycan-N-acetylglucosamine deacetylase